MYLYNFIIYIFVFTFITYIVIFDKEFNTLYIV